ISMHEQGGYLARPGSSARRLEAGIRALSHAAVLLALALVSIGTQRAPAGASGLSEREGASVKESRGAGQMGSPPPLDWIDPATGLRVVRLSADPGTASLYFHQNAYAGNDTLVVSTPKGLSSINLRTRRIEPIVDGRVSHVVVGKKSRRVFYIREDTVYATG